MIFQHHTVRNLSSPAVYGHARCMTSHFPQFSCAVGIPFLTTNTNNMDMQGVSLSTTCSLEVQWVSHSSAPTPVQGLSISIYLQFKCAVDIPLTNTSSWTCRVYPIPPPAVWTCKVHLSTTSSVNVQGAYRSIACCEDVQGVHATLLTFVKCFYKCRNARLSGIQSVRYRNQQKS
jgi:hypothetical protein